VSRPGALTVLLASLVFALYIPACQGNARLIPYTGTHGFKVVLENNPRATDPSWDQLKAFLIEDKTDERDYVLGDFVCGSFAQDVHNNAEKAGIRAAWVAIDLANKPIGHAINAFNTTDRGMAFTDSTGDTAEDNEAAILKPELEENGDALTGHSRDRIAYVVKGKELGFISLDTAQFPDYFYYEQFTEKSREYTARVNEYNAKMKTYNDDVRAFNGWVNGKVFIAGSPEARRAEQWKGDLRTSEYMLKTAETSLENAGAGLGPIWKPLGIVSKIDIRW
jgi:hypothetical protein